MVVCESRPRDARPVPYSLGSSSIQICTTVTNYNKATLSVSSSNTLRFLDAIPGNQVLVTILLCLVAYLLELPLP